MKPLAPFKTIPTLMALLCAGCSGWQSALDSHGVEAGRLATLFWFIMGVCAVVWLLVMAVLVAALLRRRGRGENQHGQERRLGLAVAAAVASTATIITILTLASFITTRAVSSSGRDALEIEVRGFQWWWQVTYAPDGTQPAMVTANEIHIPVGRPVRLMLVSSDVIHSFWVPSLAGKLDLIPGRTNELTLTATRAGLYRGQCAEFCGLQHAHMGMTVIAQTPEEFARWRAAQALPAGPPGTPEEEAGLEAFLSTPCAACHTVRGTQATGKLGPDLTHVGSRRHIGAGLLETTRGSLAAWIADPQTLKPGNNMPMVSLTPDQLRAISAYLASLR